MIISTLTIRRSPVVASLSSVGLVGIETGLSSGWSAHGFHRLDHELRRPDAIIPEVADRIGGRPVAGR